MIADYLPLASTALFSKDALLVVVSLIVIEGLLSVDNALAIAAMASHLDEKKRKVAMTVGYAGAYGFRIIALFIADYIIDNHWLMILGAGYLIWLTVNLGGQVFAVFGEQTLLTKAIIALLAVLSVGNAALLIYVVWYVGSKVLAGAKLPLITVAGLVFFAFLDWLLIVWFWDPGYLYGIGWQNTTSMVFMIIMYVLAAAIYFGFSAYRKRQGIDVDKVYKEIPVE